MSGCPYTIHANVKAPVVEYMGCCYEYIRPESAAFCPELPTYPTCFDCFNRGEPGPGPSPSPGGPGPGPSPSASPVCREDLCYCTKDFTEYGVCEEIEEGSLKGMVIVSMYLKEDDDALKNNLILFAGKFSIDPNEFPVNCKVEVTQTREKVYWVKEDKQIAYADLPLGERFQWLSSSAVNSEEFPFERPNNGVFKVGEEGRITMYPAIPHPCGLGDMTLYTTRESLQERNRDHNGLFDSWNPAALWTNRIGPPDLVSLLESNSGQALDEVEEDLEKYMADVSARRHEADIEQTIDYGAEFPEIGPPRIIHDSKTGMPIYLDETCTPKVVTRSTHTFNYFDKAIFANKPVRVKAVAGGFDIGYIPVNVYNITKDPISLNLKQISEASWEVNTEPLGNFEEIITFEDALKKQADWQEDEDDPRTVSKFLFGDFKQSFDEDVVKENILKQARCNAEQFNNSPSIDPEDIQTRQGEVVSEFIGANTLSSSIVRLSDVEDGDIVYLTGIFVEKSHFRQIVQTHTAIGNDRPRYFNNDYSVNEVTYKSHEVEQRVYSNAGIPWPTLDDENGVEIPFDDEDFDPSFWFEESVYSYGHLLTLRDNKAIFEEDNDGSGGNTSGIFTNVEKFNIFETNKYNDTVTIRNKSLTEMFNFVLKPHTINGVKTYAWRLAEIVSDPWMLYKKMFRVNPDDTNAPFRGEGGDQSVDLCYGMDNAGIKKIIMKSDGTFTSELLVPASDIRDQNWFKEYMEAYNSDINVFASPNTPLDSLLLVNVSAQDGLFDNDSDRNEIDRVRWTYAMLSGLLFDVSDIVNENLTDHEKLPYMRDFAYALNDACVPHREMRLFKRAIDENQEYSSFAFNAVNTPRSVSKYDPEEGVESPCENSGVGEIPLDIFVSEDVDVDLVEKENDIVRRVNDMSFSVFEPQQIISCKVDRAVFTGGDDFEPPVDENEETECPKDDTNLITRPPTNVPSGPGVDFVDSGVDTLDFEQNCPPGVPVNYECCVPRPVLVLPRTYDPFPSSRLDTFDETELGNTYNTDTDTLAYMRRVGVKRFAKCDPCFEYANEDTGDKNEFINIFRGSPSSKEGEPQVKHFVNADMTEIKQQHNIYGIHGDFGEGFSAYVETFSIDRQNPLALDRIEGCEDEPTWGGYKNKNADTSYKDYMGNFECLGIYPEIPIEFFNVQSNKIVKGNVSVATNPYLRSGIVTTPTYFHNNISFNFVGTEAALDFDSTATGVQSKKLDGNRTDGNSV